jgi:hypothetical protein
MTLLSLRKIIYISEKKEKLFKQLKKSERIVIFAMFSFSEENSQSHSFLFDEIRNKILILTKVL